MNKSAAAVVALFPSAQALMDAVPKVKEKELGSLEAYTPYPVHGLSQALGLKRSPLGMMVFGMGFLGACLALLFQWWTSASDYPVRIGGKAFFSWQAFVPIMFEVMVLFAAFTAGLGMLLLLNKLPLFSHPVLHSKAIARITRDRFALSVEAVGGVLDVDTARAVLVAVGGEEIEVLYPYVAPGNPDDVLPLRETAAILLACVIAGVAMYQGIKWFPILPPMNSMEVQEKTEAYRPSDYFADGLGMRLPAEGTVARGHLPLAVADEEEAALYLVNPLPRDEKVFARGRARYDTYCRVCHGALGEGDTSLSEEYKAKPANLHSSTIRDYPDGRIYYVITKGKNTMSGYAYELTPDDRWAVVHYVRALQRALNAKEEDLP